MAGAIPRSLGIVPCNILDRQDWGKKRDFSLTIAMGSDLAALEDFPFVAFNTPQRFSFRRTQPVAEQVVGLPHSAHRLLASVENFCERRGVRINLCVGVCAAFAAALACVAPQEVKAAQTVLQSRRRSKIITKFL